MEVGLMKKIALGQKDTTFAPMDDTFHAKGDVEKGVPRSSLQRLANLNNNLIWRSIISATEHIDLTETSSSSSSGHKQPDADHVFLPSYPRNGSTDRWTTIKSAFRSLIEGRVANGDELKELIYSYNGSYRSKWDLKGLVQYCDAMSPSEWSGLCATMGKMATLALDVEKIVPSLIPFLKQGMNASIALSKKQIACLLAHAFFCTFPMRNDDPSDAFPLPSINFTSLYRKQTKSSKLVAKSKLNCILHYFNRVTSRMPIGQVVFKRQSPRDSIQWKRSKTQFTELHVSSYGSIEAENGLLQVDFANKFVGGGVLGHGCVQEEVLFLISPELILSRLFTESLEDDEVLIITGSEIYSRHRGYGDTFEWMGDYVDRTSSEHGVKLTQIVAMDALRFDEDDDQFEVEEIERELDKAYCGFYCDFKQKSDVLLPAVSTGNWGCGVFRGDKHLKSLIQMMAAAEAGRDVCYFTYGDQELVHKMFQVHELIRSHNLTVGAVYHLIMDYIKQLNAQRSRSSVKLYDYISGTLNRKPGRA